MVSDNEILKKEVQKIKGLKGKARGQTLRNALQCTLIMEGKEGMVKLEKEMKELNCWVDDFRDPKKIKSFQWYPLYYDILIIVVAASIFNWDEEEIRQFGYCNQKVSFFEKTLLKYFISFKVIMRFVPERWRKHYSVGDLEPVELNEKEKYAIVRLRNFSVHPVFCNLLSGYFESAVRFVITSKKMGCQETKCVFRGDSYHEFIIRWK